jgi:hypothetical protein
MTCRGTSEAGRLRRVAASEPVRHADEAAVGTNKTTPICGGGRHGAPRYTAHAAAYGSYAANRNRRRYSFRAKAVGTFQHRHNGNLYARDGRSAPFDS